MAKKQAKPSKAMVLEAFALARELGWTSLNEQERLLIQTLRMTTYHGRNLVIELAAAMRQSQPWSDHPATAHQNTRSTHPASDRRYFNP